jgi:hypothetical protein
MRGGDAAREVKASWQAPDYAEAKIAILILVSALSPPANGSD